MPEAASPRNRTLDQALEHLELGFRAFSVWSTGPDGVCRCVKGAACTSPGKHPIPRDGFLGATADPAQLTTMLAAGSEPNYGIVWPEGGRILVVLDVDGPGWKARTAELAAKLGRLPPTKTTRTPSGGLHLFYWWPSGIPVPEGNTLHGFVARFPWKGYVVGPGSRINGKVYSDEGGFAIAELPRAWASVPDEAVSPPKLIVVGSTAEGYQLPDSIPTGSRHDEITRFVASRWNRGISYAEIASSVREVLVPLMVERPSDEKIKHDIDEAYRTADKKWKEPAGDAGTPGPSIEIVIDPLAIESRIDRPDPLDLHAVPVPVGVAMILDHLTPITDAPFSSLALASVVGLAGLMGSHPTLRWRGTQRLILYGALVGDSNYARKGQAISEVMSTLDQIDPGMMSLIKTPYIPSSGPAFIDALAESKGESVLMVTTEMGRVLANAARENETLSYDMRDAWDGVPVGGRTRMKGKVNARDYHLSILGATTPEDLVAKLTETDLRNGWANRWLWFWAERRDGGFNQTAQNVVDPAMAKFIADGIEFARASGGSSKLIAPAFTMSLTPGAESMLDAISTALDVPAHGTIGVLRQRMPPIAVRIAMVAALLDQTRQIEVDHVDFGFALTDYAVQSIRAVFGTRIEDEVAKTILDILKQSPDLWLNTSTIAKAIRKDGSRTNKALTSLLAAGLIVREDRPTPGRPSIGYRLRTF